MVHLYMAKCADLPDPLEKPEILELLPESRAKKILRYKIKKKRIQSLAASILLQKVLKMYGHSMEEIIYGESGKPEIEGFYFNLSHSEDMAICAVSEQAIIGCDIERIQKAPIKVADRFFTQNECAYLQKMSEIEYNEEFYRIWTLKESYMKMTGEGLKVGLRNLEFIFNEKVEGYRDGKHLECFFKEYRFPEYRIAICTEDEEFLEQIEHIRIS